MWFSKQKKIFYFLFLQYFIPFGVISFVYIQMAIRLWGSKTPGNAQDTRDITLMRNKKRVRISVGHVFIFIFFFFFFFSLILPFVLFFLLVITRSLWGYITNQAIPNIFHYINYRSSKCWSLWFCYLVFAGFHYNCIIYYMSRGKV